MKLNAKILLFILALIAASLFVNVHYTRLEVTTAMSGYITEVAGVIAGEMEQDLSRALSSKNEMQGIKLLQDFAEKTGATYCALVSPDGKVRAHTNVALAGTRMEDDLFLRASSRGTVFDRMKHRGEEIVDAVIPLRAGGDSGEALLLDMPVAKATGFLRAGLPLAHAGEAEKNMIRNLLLLALGIAAAAVFMTLLFSRLILRQVQFLGEGIRKVAAGETGVTVPVASSDELGEVAASFNDLLKKLETTTVSMRYMDAIVQSLPDPLLITEESGVILKANRAAQDFSGYDFAGRDQLNIKDILEPQAEGAADPFALLAWSGYISELDLWLKNSDGIRRPVMLSATFIDASPRRQVIMQLRDMTQHREAEARVAQYLKEVETVNNELDSFAHTVSHDLKEPLRGIEMFSGMLLTDHAAKIDPQGADYLGRITKAASRMRLLIDDLLGYARLARVRNPYEEAPTGKLVEEALAALSTLIEARKAKVTVAENLPVIYCDPVKMRQLFQNLVSNAVRYNDKPEPGVDIRAEKFGEYYWKFSVSDDGIGIPSQYYEDIFKIFKRLHGRQDYGGGTGAGLAIVKKIAEEHNGKAWVESEEGSRTTFFILLPADLRKRP